MIKNAVEEEVISIVESLYVPDILHPRGIQASASLKRDIICFILNRIPARYVSSMKGYNYFLQDQNYQARTDIFTLFFLALDSIKDRVGSQEELPTQEGKRFFFNFPRFIGHIYDGATLQKLSEVKVSYFLDDELIVSKHSNFENPYTTHDNTQGIYSFWIEPIESEEQKPVSREFFLKIVFEHPEKDRTIVCENIFLQSENDFFPYVRMGNIFRLKPAYL